MLAVDAAAPGAARATAAAALSEGWILDPPVVAALDRQAGARRAGARVVTLIAGSALAAHAAWGTWAAHQGQLILATDAADPDAVTAALLAQVPWLRCVPAARARLAAAAGLSVDGVDAALDARSSAERARWIGRVGALDPHVQVAGWLLSWIRAPVPEPVVSEKARASSS